MHTCVYDEFVICRLRASLWVNAVWICQVLQAKIRLLPVAPTDSTFQFSQSFPMSNGLCLHSHARHIAGQGKWIEIEKSRSTSAVADICGFSFCPSSVVHCVSSTLSQLSIKSHLTHKQSGIRTLLDNSAAPQWRWWRAVPLPKINRPQPVIGFGPIGSLLSLSTSFPIVIQIRNTLAPPACRRCLVITD